MFTATREAVIGMDILVLPFCIGRLQGANTAPMLCACQISGHGQDK